MLKNITIKGQKILCISTMDWDGLWTRKQRFMSMLAENNNVYYVNFNKSIKSAEIRTMFGNCDKTNNVFVIDFPSNLPFTQSKNTIHKLNIIKEILFLKKVVGKIDILWLYRPDTADYVGKFNERVSLYDCVDDHSQYPTPMLNVNYREKKLVEKVSFVVVTAKNLLHKFKEFREKVIYVPNGVDYDYFQKVLYEKNSMPKDLLYVKRPIIGFVGSIQKWIDVRLIDRLAADCPDYSFALVGQIGKTCDINIINKLKRKRNVHFLGKKHHIDIPYYIKEFDVCLNPFIRDKLSKSVSPLKVYEYLAMGKPVVSTKMDEVNNLNFIYLADQYEKFLYCIDEALKEDVRNNESLRFELARSRRWDNLLSLITKQLELYI